MPVTIKPDPVINLDEVMSSANEFAAQLQDAASSLTGLSDQHDFHVEQEVGAIQKEAELAGAVKKAQDQLVIDREARNKEAAAAWGTNRQAQDSVIRELSQQIIDEHKDLQKRGKDILAKRDVSFSEDPIDYIVNAFALPREVAAYNTAESIMERNIDTANKLFNLTQEEVRTNNATSATTNANISAMEAERLAQAAQVKVAEARQNAARFGLQTASVRLAINRGQFEAVLQQNQAEATAARLSLERDQKLISQEMLDLQRKNLQLTIQKKDEDEKARAEFQGQLDNATALVGMRRVDVQQWDRLPQQTKQALFDIMSNPNSLSGRLGSDPIDALRNVDAINAPLTPNLNLTKDKLNNIVNDVIGKHPEWKSLSKDQQNAVLNKEMLGRLQNEYNNIPDSGGIYSAPPLKSLAGIPAVTATTLWKSTLAPMALNEHRPTPAQFVFDTAADFVATGKMSLDQAAKEISQIYSAAVADNSQTRDYKRFALPVQTNYRTMLAVNGNGIFVGKQNIDLTNENAVRNALLRSVTQRKAIGQEYGFGHQ